MICFEGFPSGIGCEDLQEPISALLKAARVTLRVLPARGAGSGAGQAPIAPYQQRPLAWRLQGELALLVRAALCTRAKPVFKKQPAW